MDKQHNGKHCHHTDRLHRQTTQTGCCHVPRLHLFEATHEAVSVEALRALGVCCTLVALRTAVATVTARTRVLGCILQTTAKGSVVYTMSQSLSLCLTNTRIQLTCPCMSCHLVGLLNYKE